MRREPLDGGQSTDAALMWRGEASSSSNGMASSGSWSRGAVADASPNVTAGGQRAQRSRQPLFDMDFTPIVRETREAQKKRVSMRKSTQTALR